MLLRDFLPYNRHPGRIAVVEVSTFRRRNYSYAQMQEGINRIAASFERLGIRKGDRIILWGDNSARWMMTFYACLLRQVVAVPMDASFSAEFVERVRAFTDARLICSDRQGSAWNELLNETASNLPELEPPEKDQLLEIIFTSGTTGEPKGVMITHENLLANLVPIHDEYQKYKKYAEPFSPLRFVHLIPLSHLFGQVMALFIPQMLEGTVIFTPLAAPQIIQATKKYRASLITLVPQELSLLRKHVAGKEAPGLLVPQTKGAAWKVILSRWWKYRRLHQRFGWKFWAFIVGAATLPVEEEEFWKGRGFAVIQGYGMTETAPSITITHPFKGMKSGFVGKKLPGLEIQIAEDGEILVRGPHVSPGYFQNAAATHEVIKDGWLHTGDLGRFDEEGNLQLLGRKKEVIVTSEGLNVYPEDVERVLNHDPRVVESAVVAKEAGPRSVVHAVLVLKNNMGTEEAGEIIQDANRQLESFQRIFSYSIWPGRELPRTSTGKLKRLAIAAGSVAADIGADDVQRLAQQLLSGAGNLDQGLMLSSLDRVELLMELESAAGATIDESAFARAKTVRDVRQVLESSSSTPISKTYPYWKWPQWLPIRLLRYLLWQIIVFPLMPLRMKVQVSGKDNLSGLNPPIFFVANHQSILDAPAILKALPDFRWKKLLAPAMGARRARIDLYAAALFFNIYPLPPTSIGLRDAIELTGELVDKGYCPLVFPEGERTPDGTLQRFRPGIGVLVHQTQIPVLPIIVEGAYKIWPIHARGPKYKGVINVHFDRPMDFSGRSPEEITTELESFFRQRIRAEANQS